MIDVKFAELHNPLFLNGKNFGVKLDPHRYREITLVYDKEDKELLVTWNKTTAHVPSPNVAYYIPGIVEDPKVVQISHPEILNISHTAQVETPYGHVHAGPGKGKVGK